VKIYRRHYCERRHRTYRTLAKCLWPRALWIVGEGPYATLAWCPRGLTVELHRTREAAEEAKACIDVTGCGGLCQGRHEIIILARTVGGRS